MSGEHLSGTEGMSEAADAFAAVMDAETPSKTKQAPSEKRADKRTAMEDIFPRRQMDRSEESELEQTERRATSGDVLGDADFGEDRDSQRQAPDEEPDEEDEGEEPDQEAQEEPPEDDDEYEDDEQAAAAFDPNQVVRITVDGEPVEVSLGEMAKGYTRTETFHRRMGELSEGVKALHAAKLELDQLHSVHVERANALEAYVQAFMPQEPDWNALRNADPVAAANLRFEWQDFMGKLDGLRQSRAAAMAELQRAQTERVRQFADANRAKLAAAHPEWRSEKVWRRDQESMKRTAREAGYTDQEVSQLLDARGFEVLLKASKYDRIMSAKPKPVRNVPKNGNGATRPRPNVSRSFDRAEKRLSRSGSVHDAAAVFERMLDNGG